MKLFVLLIALLCTTSAFTTVPTAEQSFAATLSSLNAVPGDEIRARRPFTRSISYFSPKTINFVAEDVSGNNMGYAPISHSTGQVGTYGVIGASSYVDYNSHKSANPAPFVPHSSSVDGRGPFGSSTPSQHNRYTPRDYNSCKSFTVSRDELQYFQNTAQCTAPFVPHSSTGNGRDPITTAPMSRSTGQVGRYGVIGAVSNHRDGPVDYNSHKSVSEFVPHSSTGAGGAPMSSASPSYRGPSHRH